MRRFVIVAYTPKQGKERALAALVRRHLNVLVTEDLVTDRPACLMQSKAGAIIEVFEWKSAEAIARAHESVAVNALWEEFAAVCEFTPLSGLTEASEMFAEFDAFDP